MAAERIKICRKNTCGFYDKLGESETVFLKGKEACGLCGCNLEMKCASQDSYCALKDINQDPLWDIREIVEKEKTWLNSQT